jgi:hypothetical protein
MLITDSLLVNPNASYGQHSILFLKPARIQLIIWHNPVEDQAQQDSQHTGEQENDLPRFDRRAVLLRTDGDAVCNYAAKDLADAVEAEPDVDARTLFFLGVPL